MEWHECYGSWILVPPQPQGIVHFLGGAFVATAPHLSYGRLLESLATAGYVIIATPFINTLDHQAIAHEVYWKLERALRSLDQTLRSPGLLPLYGIGHSMGCKLHLLIDTEFSLERAGNILISFNNFPVEKSIPFADLVAPSLGVNFTPSPQELMRQVEDHYQVRRNLLIQFTDDTLDQSIRLARILHAKFDHLVVRRILPGTHVTPMGSDFKWNVGNTFSPWDALGQWVRQEVYQNLNRLEDEILLWLDPSAYLPSASQRSSDD